MESKLTEFRQRQDRARARRAGRSCGTRGRRAPRRGARRSPTPASAASSPSSPTLRAAGLRARVEQRGDVRALGPGLRALGDRPPEPGREAGQRARVAGRAGGADAEQDRVAVAVVPELLDGERVAGRLALVPELLARAAPEPGLARLAGEASASSSIQASISTRPVSASWTIAARSSGCIRRSHGTAGPCLLRQLLPQRRPRRAGSSCRIDASSAACANCSASATCRAPPAPPDAITGTETAAATAAVSSRS